ncbi:MAG: hypothetical protein KGH55_02535 [Nanoarchaeota archaeon]|nr:hypothetical protein [Nanoarchaeota archaeon]
MADAIKRVIIMSPNSTNLDNIERIVSDFFRENFANHGVIGVYPVMKNYAEDSIIGKGGEILGIFDWFYERNETALAMSSRSVLRNKIVPYIEFEYQRVTGVDYRQSSLNERNRRGRFELEESSLRKFLLVELEPLKSWIGHLLSSEDYFMTDLKKDKSGIVLI